MEYFCYKISNSKPKGIMEPNCVICLLGGKTCSCFAVGCPFLKDSVVLCSSFGWSRPYAVCHNLFCRSAVLSKHSPWTLSAREERVNAEHTGKGGGEGGRDQINEEEEAGRWGGGNGGNGFSVCVWCVCAVCVCAVHPVSSELSALLFHTGEGLHADRQLPLLS